jgi:hypothetical protein
MFNPVNHAGDQKIEAEEFDDQKCLIIPLASTATAAVVVEGDKSYLVGQTGERWDITQAVSIGYDPFGFEFGIGRHAFQPLPD